MPSIVKVVWHDAQDHKDTWASEAEMVAWSAIACAIVSVGFLVSKTDRYVTLAADWDDDDKNYGRITKIPIGMVISLVEWKESSNE